MINTTKKLVFTVKGKFLVNLARQLWADENNPEKAVNILKSAFPDMGDALIFAVLTGDKTLRGDSDVGIDVIDDNATLSPCGNPLGLEEVFGRFQKHSEDMKNQLQFVAGMVAFVPSPKGPVVVPRRCTERNLTNGVCSLKDGIDLEDIPHRKATKHDRRNALLASEKEKTSWAPLPATNGITTNNGWLSPKGKFHPCGYGEHLKLACHLAGTANGERDLEQQNWVKVQENQFLWDYSGRFRPTQRQLDAVYDWCREKQLSIPGVFLGKEQG